MAILARVNLYHQLIPNLWMKLCVFHEIHTPELFLRNYQPTGKFPIYHMHRGSLHCSRQAATGTEAVQSRPYRPLHFLKTNLIVAFSSTFTCVTEYRLLL
jgi:hypothetical protein